VFTEKYERQSGKQHADELAQEKALSRIGLRGKFRGGCGKTHSQHHRLNGWDQETVKAQSFNPPADAGGTD